MWKCYHLNTCSNIVIVQQLDLFNCLSINSWFVKSWYFSSCILYQLKCKCNWQSGCPIKRSLHWKMKISQLPSTAYPGVNEKHFCLFLIWAFIVSFQLFSTKISPDWSSVRSYACIYLENIIAEEDISYFNEAWLDFTANLSADLCYKSFVVTVIWLDLRLSSFKCIDNQRNPFSTYFKTRQNAARVIFVLRWKRTWFVEKKVILKDWNDDLKR